MHTKLARIKNLKNLNIGIDRPMQQRRPRSDAAENKGMKLIGGVGELASGLFKIVLRVYSFLNQSQ